MLGWRGTTRPSVNPLGSSRLAAQPRLAAQAQPDPTAPTRSLSGAWRRCCPAAAASRLPGIIAGRHLQQEGQRRQPAAWRRHGRSQCSRHRRSPGACGWTSTCLHHEAAPRGVGQPAQRLLPIACALSRRSASPASGPGSAAGSRCAAGQRARMQERRGQRPPPGGGGGTLPPLSRARRRLLPAGC